jgi:pimeloyl-ACP methyl ester carboxylesterase
MRWDILVCLIAFGLPLSCSDDSAPTDATESAEFVDIQPVLFSTSDGFQITGSWFTSSASATPRPALILLHMFSENHLQWLPFIPDLVTSGYHVLAFDIRGHGQSTFQGGEYFPISQFDVEDLDQMPLDVEGAITWLKTIPQVDGDRIAVIGADIGANIAYVSSGLFPGVKTAVSISPISLEDQPVLLGEGIPDFNPKSILFMAAFGDGYTYTSSEFLAGQTADPKRVTGYQGAANGTSLLNNSEARAEMLNWLSENL